MLLIGNMRKAANDDEPTWQTLAAATAKLLRKERSIDQNEHASEGEGTAETEQCEAKRHSVVRRI